MRVKSSGPFPCGHRPRPARYGLSAGHRQAPSPSGTAFLFLPRSIAWSLWLPGSHREVPMQQRPTTDSGQAAPLGREGFNPGTVREQMDVAIGHLVVNLRDRPDVELMLSADLSLHIEPLQRGIRPWELVVAQTTGHGKRSGAVKERLRGWAPREGGSGRWPERAAGPQGAGGLPARSRGGSASGSGRVAAPIREDRGRVLRDSWCGRPPMGCRSLAHAEHSRSVWRPRMDSTSQQVDSQDTRNGDHCKSASIRVPDPAAVLGPDRCQTDHPGLTAPRQVWRRSPCSGSRGIQRSASSLVPLTSRTKLLATSAGLGLGPLQAGLAASCENGHAALGRPARV